MENIYYSYKHTYASFNRLTLNRIFGALDRKISNECK